MVATHTYKLAAYPKRIALQDGDAVTLKPMTPDDGEALLRFFQNVSAADRFYLKEDVTSPKVIHRWVEELDYDRALPLLAWKGDRIVADGSLHRSRSGSRRHVGSVRIVVDPEFRNKGLGRLLFHEMAAIANENDLEKLYFEAVTPQEDSAIKAAELTGFVRVGQLHDHIKDQSGHPQDLVIMEMPLGKWFEWWTY